MLIKCDATRSDGNKAHGVLMAAAFCQIYANTSHSTSALPLIVYLFIFTSFLFVLSGRNQKKKTQQSSLDGNKEARGVLYQDSRLEQRHLNPWKLPSEDEQLGIDFRLAECTSLHALLCLSQVGGFLLKTIPEMKKGETSQLAMAY